MKRSTALLCMALGISSLGWGSDKHAATPNKVAKITMARAEQVALAKEAGTIKEKELEQEKGRLIYSFDIQTKDGIREVNVDAVTGKVVEDSLESAVDEAKEKR